MTRSRPLSFRWGKACSVLPHLTLTGPPDTVQPLGGSLERGREQSQDPEAWGAPGKLPLHPALALHQLILCSQIHVELSFLLLVNETPDMHEAFPVQGRRWSGPSLRVWGLQPTPALGTAARASPPSIRTSV